MGVTIHYQLAAPPKTDRAGAKEIARQLRQRALRYASAGRVKRVFPLAEEASTLQWGRTWRFVPVPGRPDSTDAVELMPLTGFGFCIQMGADCEPLWLGLCRYPLTMLAAARRRRTGLGGWRWVGFCKTQFSSLHGWEHFRRCHLAVIGLLEAARRLGCRVEILDEGGYWPARNETALRQNVEQLNRAIAATAGALKNRDTNAETAPVQSPIFAHPRFEHLEAEGASQWSSASLRKALG